MNDALHGREAWRPPGKRDRGRRREVGSRVSAHHGPGGALVRIQVHKPYNILILLRFIRFRSCPRQLDARLGQPSMILGNGLFECVAIPYVPDKIVQ
jgi:hypothetical protein